MSRGLDHRDRLGVSRPADRHFPILKQGAMSKRFRDGLKIIKVKKPGLASWSREIAACAPIVRERPGNDQLSNRIEALMTIGVHPDEARVYRRHSKSGSVA